MRKEMFKNEGVNAETRRQEGESSLGGKLLLMKKMVEINGKNNKETKEVGGLKQNGGRSRDGLQNSTD